MKLSWISILIAAATAFAQTTEIPCDTEPSAEDVLQLEADFAAKKVNIKADPITPISINVNFHVIYKDMTSGGGYVSDDQISNQIDALNTAFVDTSITFILADTTRNQSSSWFNIDRRKKVQLEMKTALREGDSADLNIYTVGSIIGGSGRLVNGYATFPANYAKNAMDDGVVVTFARLPGTSSNPSDPGRTVTHEVGHWVGLYHTFQGGCTAPGDSVDDTAPEAEPAFGCPEGRDTCDGGGSDPIHNFMDYTDPTCRNNFTPGQVERLRSQIATYRT